MPLMEVTLSQLFIGQEIINRWNYLASGTPAAVSFSFALISAMGAIPDAGVYPPTGIIMRIRNLQDSGVSFEQIAVKDVYSVTDFYTTTFVPSLAGAVSGVSPSPTLAFGFRTNRTRLDVRRGTKRFVGVPAAAFDNDNNFNLTNRDAMDLLAQAMSAVLTYDDEGNTLTFTPVIAGKEKYSPSGDPSGPFAYRYYPTFSEQSDHLMSSIIWDRYNSPRTQVSRQVGRGR